MKDSPNRLTKEDNRQLRIALMRIMQQKHEIIEYHYGSEHIQFVTKYGMFNGISVAEVKNLNYFEIRKIIEDSLDLHLLESF